MFNCHQQQTLHYALKYKTDFSEYVLMRFFFPKIFKTDRERDRQTDRQTDRQKDRQRARAREREREIKAKILRSNANNFL